MNEHAKELVKVLRSGEFQQGQGQLRTKDDHYCCLGVACELHRRVTGLGRWEWFEDDWSYVVTDKAGNAVDRNDSVLPEPVMKYFGFGFVGGSYSTEEYDEDDYDKEFPYRRELTEDNDGGRSFEEIASIIESGPKGLFR
jgi:hypothetical protein